jgi:hypothetical protein
MRTITTLNAKTLTELTLEDLTAKCKLDFVRLTIHNGVITDAIQIHRDYVWVTDGRKNYIEKAK